MICEMAAIRDAFLNGIVILTALVLPVAFSQTSELVDQPLALVAHGNPARISDSSHSLAMQLERGVELFAGDTIRADSNGDVLIAFCPPSGEASLLKLARGSQAVITESGVSSTPPAIVEREIPICRIPKVHRAPRPGTDYDPDEVHGRNTETPSADQQRELDRTAPLDGDPSLDLIARTTRAALLESFGLPQSALRELREIRRIYPEATWTRDVISRLLLERLPEPVSNHPSARGTLLPENTDQPGEDPDFSSGEKYALIVGLSEYPAGKRVTNLRFADKDAELFDAFLTSKRGGSLPPSHIQLLTNEKATRDGIDQALLQFVQGKGGPRNTLIVFIAAHGNYVCTDKDPDLSPSAPCEDGKQEPVIIVRDGETEAPTVTGYSMLRLRDLVTQRAAEFGRVLVYVDVCHSGNVNWRAGDSSLTPSDVLAGLEAGNGRLGIMTASSVELKGKKQFEYAYESDRLGHGVFTYYLVQGLNGGVRAIDGKVLFESVFAEVSSAVLTFTGRLRQVPEHYRSDPGLVAVDNDAKPEIDLTLRAGSVGDEATRRSADAGGDDPQTVPLAVDDPDKAAQQLESIRAQYGDQSPIYISRRTDYRVALENQGQQIVVKYLEGDQNPEQASDFHRCADYFSRALAIASDAAYDEARRLFCEGRELIFRGEYAEADTRLLRAIRIDPGRPYAYNAIGIANLEQARFDDAIAAFRDAIRLAPYWAYPRHNLALTLAERGRYADAVAQYRDAETVAPMYSYLPYNLGLLYQQLNRVDDARRSYREAERVAQKRCEVRFGIGFTQPCQERALPRTGLGALAALQHKRKAADSYFKQARQDDPKDLLAAHNDAALLADWKGHEPEAERIWTANLAQDPFHTPSLIGYTNLLKRERRYDEAIPLYRRLTEKMKEYVPAQIDLASALARTNNFQEATALLDRLVQERPRNAGVWAARAELLDKENNRDGAKSAWESALRLAAGSPDEKEIRRRRQELERSK